VPGANAGAAVEVGDPDRATLLAAVLIGEEIAALANSALADTARRA
jgi:hypothetical protein